MNILILHQYFLEDDGAGGGRFNEMTKIWAEQGHKISVLAGMMPDHTGKKRNEYRGKKIVLNRQGLIDVYRCHVNESYNKNYFGRSLGYLSFLFYSLWAGLFKLQNKIDIVLVTSPPIFIGITAYILSLRNKVPMIFEVRDLWPESAIDTGVIKNSILIKLAYKLEAFIYSKANLICVLTPAFREILINLKNIDKNKIIYIPNAADIQLSKELLKTFKPKILRKNKNTSDKFVVVYVGAHGLANGLHQILDAAELLKETNVQFWLIGKGMKRNELIAEASRRQLINVEFLDPMPRYEVFKYILAADMGVSVLTKNETFKTIYSNKTFDYMACKKPVLMVIEGISKELIEEANAGTYIEPEIPFIFAEKVRIYMRSPDLLREQGENGYQYVLKNFERSRLAKEYLANIKIVVERG